MNYCFTRRHHRTIARTASILVALVLGTSTLAPTSALAEITITGDASAIPYATTYIGMSGSGQMQIDSGSSLSSGYSTIGFYPGSIGTVTVTGQGSAWYGANYIVVGQQGSGFLNIENGGQVYDYIGDISNYSDSTSAVTVTGQGSAWYNTGHIDVGQYGNGSLTIKNGGQVISNNYSALGNYYGSTGTAIVTGQGSIWKTRYGMYVGEDSDGSITIADGGKVIAANYSISSSSKINLDVSNNDMLVTNMTVVPVPSINNGQINLYANAFLPNAIYTPIADYAGGPPTWTGTGTYNAVGGEWNNTDHTFTVTPPTTLPTGNTESMTNGERLLFTEPNTSQHVGVSFGSVADGTTFSASLMPIPQQNSLLLAPGFTGNIITAWNFVTNFTGGDVLLSFDIGTDWKNLQLWHYANGSWSLMDNNALLSYDSAGHADFLVSSFSDYALSGIQIPEPASLILMSTTLLLCLNRPRRCRR